ncbi:MAG TPA: DUF3426 domain-containing protein [Casimicrobiaceae bacterium]|nr:DUF3426 domain-containing protein [Casimicrobiaceae bacterium]
MTDAILTRCPGCSTVFRVTAAQLALREGQVRCGHCRAVFDANAEHVSLDATPPPRPVDAPEQPAAHLDETAEFDTYAGDLAEGLSDETGSLEADAATAIDTVASDGTAVEATAVAGASDERAAGEGAAHEGAAHEGAAHEGAADEGAADEGAAGERTSAVPSPDEGTADEATRDETSLAEDAPDAATVGPTDATREPEPAALAPSGFAQRSPASRFEWKQHPTTGVPSTRLYAAAGALLIVALLAQALFEYRDALAANAPASRPLLSAACALFGCTIEPPRDAGALSIDASDLQADPAHRGLLLLSATLRNRSTHAIAFPYLELTLTDASDRIVARRAFAPAEYAGGAADPHRGIPANGEHVVRVFLDASATQQAGYRLYLFYP